MDKEWQDEDIGTTIPELSLVILCYKEGEAVRGFVAKTIRLLEENGILDYELVLVGNYHEGTGDITPQVVSELAAIHPKIFHSAKPKQGMMGWDMKSGLDLTSGNYIAVIDGDGQFQISDVVKVYRKISEAGLDLVKTHRLTRGDGWLRRLISFKFNLISRVLFPGIKSKDINAQPKIFSRQAYQKMKLTSDDWFIDAEIMIQARRYGFKVEEIPTTFSGLTGRRSFINFNSLLEFIRNLLKARLAEFKHKKR